MSTGLQNVRRTKHTPQRLPARLLKKISTANLKADSRPLAGIRQRYKMQKMLRRELRELEMRQWGMGDMQTNSHFELK